MLNPFAGYDRDYLDVLIQDERDRDQYGNSLGLRLKTVGWPCAYRSTPNYDEDSSQAGNTKTINIITADGVRYTPTLTILNRVQTLYLPSQCVVRTRLRDGRSLYWTVNGVSAHRVDIPRCQAYLLTTAKPLISPNSATYAMFAGTQVYSNQVKCGTIGTAVPFSVQSVPLSNGVTVIASENNAFPVCLGGPSVSNVYNGTGSGIVLAPGREITIGLDDLSLLYANFSGANDFVSYSAS